MYLSCPQDEVIVPGEPDMYGHQGYMSEGVHGGHNHHHHNHHVHSMATALPPHDYAYDPSHPDPMAHHHHHYPGHYHHHQSGYRSGPGEGDRTYHPDDYDAPDSAGRLPHYGNPGRHPYPEQYQSGDRFAETVKQAMASHRSVSSGSSAPNSPTGLSPLSPRRAGLVDGTAGSMTHQRSRFAPDRQISSNLPPPLVIAHRAGSTPGSGSTAVLSPSASTAAAAAALANATVSVTGMPPGGAAYDSVDAQGQHQLMDSTNELATALAVAPVRARRKSNLGGRAANGAAAPYGNGGGGNANGTDHPAGGEGGSRRVLNKVESLREGIAGAPGGDVPASRRFLDKVESLKEAGIDTLPAAGSPLAREVMEDGRPGGPAFGAAGRTSANRRVPRTISATSVDLGAAASAHAAAAAGSGSLGAASQGRGPAAPAALQVLPSEEGEEHIGGRGALSPAEGGELHADGGGRWGCGSGGRGRGRRRSTILSCIVHSLLATLRCYRPGEIVASGTNPVCFACRTQGAAALEPAGGQHTGRGGRCGRRDPVPGSGRRADVRPWHLGSPSLPCRAVPPWVRYVGPVQTPATVR